MRFTVLVSLAVVALNIVTGTLIAWVLVRDEFSGKRLINALIDLPFALPTIVAGLVLLELYGPGDRPRSTSASRASRLRWRSCSDAALRRALRSAGSDGARPRDGGGGAIARRRPADGVRTHRAARPRARDVAGAGLAFARALGEFGSVVPISGNLPFDTEVASVFLFGQIESDNTAGAAAMSVVLLVLSLLLLLFVSWIATRGERRSSDVPARAARRRR